jgi:hypothetical protein
MSINRGIVDPDILTDQTWYLNGSKLQQSGVISNFGHIAVDGHPFGFIIQPNLRAQQLMLQRFVGDVATWLPQILSHSINESRPRCHGRLLALWLSRLLGLWLSRCFVSGHWHANFGSARFARLCSRLKRTWSVNG